jgi:Tfp pilus assembly protein PilV
LVNNEKGITLIEIMAAAVILGMIVIGFVNLSTFGAKANSSVDRSAEALSLAEKQLSIQRAYYDQIPASSVLSGLQLKSSSDANGFRTVIQLSDLSNPTYSNTSLKRVVYAQAVVVVKSTDGTQGVPRLLTVSVSWDG